MRFNEKELKIIIEAQDKASSAFRKIEQLMEKIASRYSGLIEVQSQEQQTLNAFNTSLEKAVKTLEKFSKTVESTQRSFQSFSKALKEDTKGLNSLAEAEKTVAKATEDVEKAHKKVVLAFKRVATQIENLTKKTAALLYPFNSLKKTVVFLASGMGMGLMARSLIDTASAFEQFRVQLETTTGSIQKAQMAMAWITDFAAKTPYELEEVTQAFIKLQSYGIDPTNGVLKVLGDTASSMGKSLDQAVEALADAIQGEFERLKEFGIRARATADQVTFYYMKAGQQMTVTVKNSAEEIQKALMGIWGDKFAGGMERMSHTLKGMLSNLSDYWTQFENKIMISGVYSYIEAFLDTVLERIQQLQQTGDLDKWAKKVGRALTTAFEGTALALSEIPIILAEVEASFMKAYHFFGLIEDKLKGVLGLKGPAGVFGWKDYEGIEAYNKAVKKLEERVKELRQWQEKIRSFFEDVDSKVPEYQKALEGSSQATQKFVAAQKSLGSALQETLDMLNKQAQAAKTFQKEIASVMEKYNWQLMTPEQRYNYVKDKLQDLWNEAWSEESVEKAREYVKTYEEYLELLSKFEGKEQVLEKFKEDLEELARVFNSEYFEDKKNKLLSGLSSDDLVPYESYKEAKERINSLGLHIKEVKSLLPIELSAKDNVTPVLKKIEEKIDRLREITIDVKVRPHVEDISVAIEKAIKRGQINLEGGTVG